MKVLKVLSIFLIFASSSVLLSGDYDDINAHPITPALGAALVGTGAWSTYEGLRDYGKYNVSHMKWLERNSSTFRPGDLRLPKNIVRGIRGSFVGMGLAATLGGMSLLHKYYTSNFQTTNKYYKKR